MSKNTSQAILSVVQATLQYRLVSQQQREKYNSLPEELKWNIESIVNDTIVSLESAGFRVSHMEPADKLAVAIMNYVYDSEALLMEKGDVELPPMVVSSGNC